MISFPLNIEALQYAQDVRLRPAVFKRWTHNDKNLSRSNADD